MSEVRKMQGAIAPWELHGPLGVTANGHYLEYVDGAPFFWLGDTAWKIIQLTPDQAEHYLADRRDKGFSVIQINASNWADGDYAGRQPFAGSGPPWSSVRLDEVYWSHVDYTVEAAARHGMHVAIFALWGPNAGKPEEAFFTDPEVHNYEYGYALGQRYRDAPHVIWVASGEYHHISADRQSLNSMELMYLRRIAEGLNDGSGGTHLITLHPGSPRSSSGHWHECTWLSFNMIQTFGREWGSTDLVPRDYGLSPVKPVINGEPGYEGRHLHLPQRGIMDAWHLRLEAYCSLFSGAFGYTYGHVTIWHFGTVIERDTGWERYLDAEGAGQMRHVRALMESKPILDRVPDNALITSDRGSFAPDESYVVATRGLHSRWAFIYTTQGHRFTVDMGRLRGELAQARWFDPRTGEYQCIGTYRLGGEREFDTPGEPGRGNDWVLVLDTSMG